MQISELMRNHERFETDRGISTFNNLAHGLIRVQEEILEAQYALLDGDLEHTLQEILDFVNYSMSLLLHVCNDLGVAPEQVDTMLVQINQMRDQKYRIELFREYPAEEAIRIARQEWTMARLSESNTLHPNSD